MKRPGALAPGLYSFGMDWPARRVAVVDVERLRGHIDGVLRSQDHGGTFVVVGTTETAKRHGFLSLALGCANRTAVTLTELAIDLDPHVRVDDARRDAVDVDAMLGEFECRRLRSANDSRVRSP